ncbi:MAG: hypothetical protein JSS89_10175 [Bacteroidetes bacterium]|nr:hypothetical protein [Bacteroidota bacterium]
MRQQHRRRLLAAGIVIISILAAMIAKADIHPAGGIQQRAWQPGGTMHITWTQNDVRTTAQILLWNADVGEFTELARGIDAETGFFDWVIPSTLPMSDHYRIAVRDEGALRTTIFAQGFLTIGPVYRKSQSTLEEEDPVRPMISVGPNPTSQRAHVRWNDERTMCVIRQLTGVEVQRMTISAEDRSHDIDVHDLSSGTYSIELVSALGDRLRTLLVVQ